MLLSKALVVLLGLCWAAFVFFAVWHVAQYTKTMNLVDNTQIVAVSMMAICVLPVLTLVIVTLLVHAWRSLTPTID